MHKRPRSVVSPNGLRPISAVSQNAFRPGDPRNAGWIIHKVLVSIHHNVSLKPAQKVIVNALVDGVGCGQNLTWVHQKLSKNIGACGRVVAGCNIYWGSKHWRPNPGLLALRRQARTQWGFRWWWLWKLFVWPLSRGNAPLNLLIDRHPPTLLLLLLCKLLLANFSLSQLH